MKAHFTLSGFKGQALAVWPVRVLSGLDVTPSVHQKENSTFSQFSRWLVLVLLVLGFGLTGQAQQIHELKSYMNEMRSSADPALAAEGARLKSLVSDLHPTEYLNWGQQKKASGGDPVVVRFDAKSVNRLYGNNPAYQNVELLKVKVGSPDELKSAIDLSRLPSGGSLKYLIIVFTYDVCGGGTDKCLSGKVRDMVTGAESPVVVLYELSIPQ